MWSLTSETFVVCWQQEGGTKNKILFPVIQQYPETSLLKRIPRPQLHSLPKLLSLPQCTRNKTDPDPQPALATPSSPTWGNGPEHLRLGGVQGGWDSREQGWCGQTFQWMQRRLEMRALAGLQGRRGMLSHTDQGLSHWGGYCSTTLLKNFVTSFLSEVLSD